MMSTHLAAALVVLSALFHAGWNALLHRFDDRAKDATFVVLVLSLMLSLTASLCTDAQALWGVYTSMWTWLSGASEGLYFITLGIVMQRLPLGLGYLVMRGVSMLCVTALSVSFLGESIGVVKGFGMAAIGFGVLLRGMGDALRAAPVDGRGLVAALGCALGITGYHMAYGIALGGGAHALPLFAASLSIAVVINFAILGPRFAARAMSATKGHIGALVVAAVGCLGAFWLFLACLASLHAGVAICLRNLSVVFAQGMAWRLGERLTPRAVMAVGFFVIGGVLLVLAP